MFSFFRLVVLLSLLATTSVAAADGPPELHTGAHALIVELKTGGEERELYHDVWIRSEEGRLTLEVRKDPPPIEGGLGSQPRGLGGPQQEQDVPEPGDEQPKADDPRPVPPSKPKRGWGSKMGGPHEGQEVWLAKGRKFTGLIDEDGKAMGVQARGKLRVRDQPILPPGSPSVVPLVSPFYNVRFPEPKGYTFVIRHQDDELGRIRLRVVHTQ